MQDDENQQTLPRPGQVQWPPYDRLPEPAQWPPYPTAPQVAPWQQPTVAGPQATWSSYGGQARRRPGMSQLAPRLPRREALARARSLKVLAAVVSVLGFGTLGALAATHNASASASSDSNSSGLPGSDQNQGNNGGQQDNGGFFGNGGAGFGSGNFQRPSSSSSVS